MTRTRMVAVADFFADGRETSLHLYNCPELQWLDTRSCSVVIAAYKVV